MEAVALVERIVVVLGARADEIQAGVDFGSAEVVVCEDWATGQAASLRCGIAAIRETADAVVLTLGDMPKITPEVISEFAALAAKHGSETRARGMFDGAPGHPVALGSAYFDQIAALEGDVGARDVLKRIGAFPIECGHLCSGIDIDTPEALEDLRS